MKSGIVAKLAAQVSDYYETAATLLSANGTLSGSVPKVTVTKFKFINIQDMVTSFTIEISLV